jgi:DNA-directed RNA polymerase alpha subunit
MSNPVPSKPQTLSVPIVSNKSEDNGVLKFTLSKVDVSLANAIRRIILSEIPCIVFKTTPYEENKALIYTNTSRLNNEIIKQRLSSIPIHIDDLAFPIEDYILEINEKNDTDTIKIVTTEDFKIKNIKNGKYLSKEAVHKIFPPDSISTSYIDFVRLRPRLSDDIDGEHIHLECSFILSNAKDDGMFNVVSCAAFGNTVNMRSANDNWNEKERKLKEENQSDEDIEFLKKDWYALDALRYSTPNSFDFTIETIGVFENEAIVKKACAIMIEKLVKFKQDIQDNGEHLIEPVETTIRGSHDIKLEGEDYTLGKVIEYILFESQFIGSDLYNKSYKGDKKLTYCGFRKPHPHINESYIRVGGNKINKQNISEMLISSSDKAISMFNHIIGYF